MITQTGYINPDSSLSGNQCGGLSDAGREGLQDSDDGRVIYLGRPSQVRKESAGLSINPPDPPGCNVDILEWNNTTLSRESFT